MQRTGFSQVDGGDIVINGAKRWCSGGGHAGGYLVYCRMSESAGAKGIGAKTAAALLNEYGSLEGVLAAADGLRPRIAATLREQADELRAFHRIATLRDIDVARPPSAATDHAGGADAARTLGMNQLAKRLETLAAEAG